MPMGKGYGPFSRRQTGGGAFGAPLTEQERREQAAMFGLIMPEPRPADPHTGMTHGGDPADPDAALRSWLVGESNRRQGRDPGFAPQSDLDKFFGPAKFLGEQVGKVLYDVAPVTGDIRAGEESYKFGLKAQEALQRGDYLGALDNWVGSASTAVMAIPIIGAVARGTRNITDGAVDGIQALVRSLERQNLPTEKRAGAMAVKKGNLVGVPPSVANAEDPSKALTAHHRRMRQSARDGEEYRFWYELSQGAISGAGKGDVNSQRTLAGLLSVYSQNTAVPANARNAFKAAYQHAYGVPLKAGRFGSMDAEAARIAAGEDPLIVLQSKVLGTNAKRMNFYMNLYDHVEPKLRGAVTVDLWMARAYGYPSDTLSAKQVEFIQNDVKRIAKELGWEPKQVQAAMWVQSLARSSGKPASSAAADFASEAERMMGQISWETAPSRPGGHLPEYHGAPFEQRVEFNELASKAMLDDAGNDMLAQEYGLVHMRDIDGVGVWKGDINPGTQTMVVMPEAALNKAGTITPEATAQIEAYAAARGELLQQEAVAWFRPFYSDSAFRRNGVEINLGRPMTKEEHELIYDIAQQELGTAEIPPVTTERGASFLSFEHFGAADNKGIKQINAEFQRKMDRVADRFAAEGTFDGEIDQVYFESEGNLVSDITEAMPNGGNYQAARSGRGRSDIPGAGDNAVLGEVQGRLDDVALLFQSRYGWTPHPDVVERIARRSQGSAPAAAAAPVVPPQAVKQN